MTKKVLILTIISFLMFVFGCSQKNQPIQVAPESTPLEVSGEKINICIIPVNDEESNVNLFQMELQNYEHVGVIERENLDEIMNELALSMTGAIAEDEVMEAAKLSSAEKFVFLEESDNWIAKIVDTQTGRTDKIFRDQNLENLAEKVGQQLEHQINLDMLGNIQHTNPKMNLSISTNQAEYDVGESVQFTFSADVDCYVTILDIQPNGDIIVLFPNEFSPDNFIRGGTVYKIPSDDDEFAIAATSPGLETVKVIATLDNIDILDSQFLSQGIFSEVKPNKKEELVKSLAIVSTGMKNKRWGTAEIQFEIK